MKKANIGLLISSAIGGCFLSLPPATATILVEPIVTTPSPEFPDGIGIPFNLQPLQVVPWSAPDTTGEQNFINNTGFTINRFSLILLPELDLLLDDDVIWGDVNGDGQIGFSNIFPTINITPDFVFQGFSAPRLDLIGGTIPNGERFTFQFITQPDLRPTEPGDNGPLVIGGAYDGFVPVPEPSTLLGFAAVIGLGGILKQRKSSP